MTNKFKLRNKQTDRFLGSYGQFGHAGRQFASPEAAVEFFARYHSFDKDMSVYEIVEVEVNYISQPGMFMKLLETEREHKAEIDRLEKRLKKLRKR